MAPTRTIAGRYELGERLGVGGMSTVQEGFDRRLERHVAVKLLAEHLAEDQQFVSRFKREALSAARLVHPNIVQVFDFGLDDESGRHYIVMEVVRGQSGAELLRERGRLPVDEALDLVGQSCRGLDYAHRNGVVHRDVKPGNLLRSDDGTVKLADFGIAKALHEESSITQVGSVLGTASYLAPEQARGDEAGPAADLYALGVVTYQLLSGRLPYEAQSLTELALKQQREAPAYLHELDPAIPEALSVAVDRALSLEPGDRPSDAAAMKELLEEGARGHGPGVEEAHDTGATRVVGADRTGATRVAAAVPMPPSVSTREPTADRPAARVPRPPRDPRPEPYHQPVDVYAPRDERPSRRDRKAAAKAERPRRRGRVKRFFVTLLILALLGIGIAVAVVSTSSDQAAVKLRSVTAKKVDGMVRQIETLIEDNTR